MREPCCENFMTSEVLFHKVKDKPKAEQMEQNGNRNSNDCIPISFDDNMVSKCTSTSVHFRLAWSL